MKFDSKTYFYYAFINELYDGKYDKEEDIEKIIRIMGDFEIKPGSLKKTEIKEGIINIGLTTNSFNAQNKDFKVDDYTVDPIGSMTLNGTYGGNRTRIKLEYPLNIDHMEMAVVDCGKGIHFYTSQMFCYGSSNQKAFYAFYDIETLDTLINLFDLSIDEITKLTPEKLQTLGFEPDKCSFTDLESIGYNSANDFVKEMLSNISYKELEERFENIEVDQDTLDKHITKANLLKVNKFSK